MQFVFVEDDRLATKNKKYTHNNKPYRNETKHKKNESKTRKLIEELISFFMSTF